MGLIRSFFRAFTQSPAIQAVAPINAPVAEKEKATNAKARQTLASGGYGSSSVLTNQQGIEDEANVSKTVLGGTVQKRKKV